MVLLYSYTGSMNINILVVVIPLYIYNNGKANCDIDEMQ